MPRRHRKGEATGFVAAGMTVIEDPDFATTQSNRGLASLRIRPLGRAHVSSTFGCDAWGADMCGGARSL